MQNTKQKGQSTVRRESVRVRVRNQLKRMAEKTYDLSTFRLERILNKNSKTKTICVLGTFPSQQSPDATEPAIVVLEKTAFTDYDVNTHQNDDNDDDNGTTQRSYFSLETQLKKEFVNDIYGNFLCFPLPAINSKFFIISLIITFFY